MSQYTLPMHSWEGDPNQPATREYGKVGPGSDLTPDRSIDPQGFRFQRPAGAGGSYRRRSRGTKRGENARKRGSAFASGGIRYARAAGVGPVGAGPPRKSQCGEGARAQNPHEPP